MKTELFSVSDVLSLQRRPASIDIDQVYVEIGVRSFGRGLFRKSPVSGEVIGNKHVFYVKEGDIVFSNVFAWEGAVAIATEAENGLIGSHRFMTYRVNDRLADAGYLFYYFTGGDGLSVIKKASPGSAGRNRTLGIKSFSVQKIDLPDLPEQRRIAARLDSALSGLTKVHDLRGRRTHLLAAHQESLVSTTSATATGADVLGRLLRPVRSPIEIDESAQYRALGMKSFGRGTIRYPEALGSELSKLRYFTFPADALALSNIKAWEGAIGVTSIEDLACVASNRFLFYVAADDRINIRYLRYYLLSRQGLAQMSSCSPGSADRNRTLSIKSFERVRIPLPSRSEQDRVAALLDSLTDNLDPARTDTVVKSLRPSLLNAAFNGQM